jgi:2-polyprenyl-3-methyl-5-hydroxy-6-metoxy-1,4-benzoquinol methylase
MAGGSSPHSRIAEEARVDAFEEPARGLRVVTTLEELDEMLGELDRRALVSDDELRRGFLTFEMHLELDLPDDPFSEEYRLQVLRMYEYLHGKPYDTRHEREPFDVAEAVARPFPYSTGSAATVGNQLIAIGHIIRTLDLGSGSRVLELGPGWGNTTLAMAQMGYEVTALDIDEKFVELIATRADRLGVEVALGCGDFAKVDELDGQFDAVLFFECFHHAVDHLGLLGKLDGIVAPGGRIAFAAEPITEDMPYPWGLRQEGEALWAIRRRGWMELGFRETYFLEALRRNGWVASKSVGDSPWGVVYVATRASEGR